MKYIRLLFLVTLAGLLSANSALAAPVVVAGSPLASPPPFLASSFWGVTANIDRAFPFEVIDGGPYLVDQLQVAVYRDPLPLGATTAGFSLHVDEGGLPGTLIATFNLGSVPTTAQVVSLPVVGPAVVLHSDMPYWIVGGTALGQLNWSLSDNEFGRIAFRVDGQEWTVLNNRNTSAFAILGTPVPEPSSLALGVVAACGLVATIGQRRPRVEHG